MNIFSFRQSIRARLLILAIGVELIMLTVLVSNSLRLLHNAMTDQVYWHMQQIIPVLNAALKAPLAQRDYATVQAVLDESRVTEGIRYIVVTDREGVLVASSGWKAGQNLPAPSKALPFFSFETSQRYDEIRTIFQSGQKLGSLHLGLDLSHITLALRALLMQGVGIAFLELILSALILILIGYWLTRHLTSLTSASLDVAAGNFTPPNLHEGDDDIGQLGTAFNAMSRAIAERVKELTAAKETAEADEKRLRSITTSANDAIIMMNARGVISYWNPAAEKILGYRPEEALGKNLHELLAPAKYIDLYSAAFPTFLKTGQGDAVGKTLELSARRKDGNEIAIALSLSAVFLNGEWNAVGILRDISELKRYEAELRAAKEAAETLNRRLEESVWEARRLAAEADKANAAKSEFLASMSHEIRTPMNAIIGMADLLWESPLDAEQRQYVKIFRSAGENLLSLINDILDISRVESGLIKLDVSTFDLTELITRTCEIMSIRAQEKKLELKCDFSPDIPSEIDGDPVRLRQILINLIGNAIKFTEHGQIVVSVKTMPPDNGHMGEAKSHKTILQFSVTDSGIGIPEDKIDSIFDKFTQADSSITRKYEGSGLGLTISRQLVSLMGGRIWVKSQPGIGSTFHFTAAFGQKNIPSHASEFTPSDMPATERGLRILLVEDSEDNRLLIQAYLKKTPHIVEIAENGEIAVEKFKKSGHDIVLMDMQMPVMDGYTATRTIRAWEAEHQRMVTPIIALTAHALKDDEHKSIEAGCNAHLTKPIKKSILLEAIYEWTEVRDG